MTPIWLKSRASRTTAAVVALVAVTAAALLIAGPERLSALLGDPRPPAPAEQILGELPDDLPPGTTPPASAVQAAAALLDPDPDRFRAGLTPDAARFHDPGQAPPVGTRLDLDADGWRADGEAPGDLAMASGVLRLPGRPAERVMLFYEKINDRWLVMVQESLA